MPKGKRIQPLPKPRYKYAIHSLHKSGIGSVFLRHEYTDTKPTYDHYWFDCTNGEWAKWNTPWDEKEYNRLKTIREARA